MDIFKLICSLTFSSCLVRLKQLHGKILSQQIGIPAVQEGPGLARMTLFTCNHRIQFIKNLQHCQDPGRMGQNFVLANRDHAISTLVYFFVSLMMQKYKKVESINIQSDCKRTSNKRTDLSCVFTHSGKVQKGEEHYTV